MKLKRGDMVIVDPLNKLKQCDVGSTIHGIVIESGWRRAYIISLETYEIFKIPKSYLVKVPDKDTPVKICRDNVFKPTFTDLEIEFVMSLIHEQRKANRNDVADVLESHILNKMQADRRDNNITVAYNLKERNAYSPNILYSIGDFVESKTLDEWRTINSQIEAFHCSIPVSSPNYSIISDWATTSENCCDAKLYSEVDNYFDGIPVDSYNIFECILELTHSKTLEDVERSYSDDVVMIITHAISLAPEAEQNEIKDDVVEQLRETGIDSRICEYTIDVLNRCHFGGTHEC